MALTKGDKIPIGEGLVIYPPAMNLSLPAPNHPCWLHLASGKAIGFQTRQLALQLMFKRLEREPLSALQKAQEIHAFFVKYERILGPEINQLVKL